MNRIFEVIWVETAVGGVKFAFACLLDQHLLHTMNRLINQIVLLKGDGENMFIAKIKHYI